MKKVLIIIATIACLIGMMSCTQTRWTTINLKNRSDIESVMSREFPELYQRYVKGEIVIDKLKYKRQDDGTTKYQVNYAIVNNDDDDELVEWICIFAPLLND